MSFIKKITKLAKDNSVNFKDDKISWKTVITTLVIGKILNIGERKLRYKYKKHNHYTEEDDNDVFWF
jgi:hypothetical protein